MTKLSTALTTAATLLVSASAFAPAKDARSVSSALSATGFEEVGGKPWDPLSLGKLEDANDTFPNMFPKSQYLQESEIKHGRMSMLAWTGVWATHVVSYFCALSNCPLLDISFFGGNSSHSSYIYCYSSS